MRRQHADDPQLSARVFDLLETVFPGVRHTAANAAALGGAWEAASTPAAGPCTIAQDLNGVVCLELDGKRLKLLDVVGDDIPPLARLVERIAGVVDEVEICFSPDRLDVATESIPCILDHDGPSYLMVHGDFPAERRPFMLPRSART